MRKILAVTALVLAAPLAAIAQDATPIAMDAELGTTTEAVTAALQNMGYEVRKTEMEDGNIEAYVVAGKQMGEVMVSPETGKVVKVDMK